MARLNEKGQAAITDALYFLLVVTSVSVLLFAFANTYGNTVSTKVTSNYNTSFSTDALKTILYSSTPRDPERNLYEGTTEIEVDHLLAFIKEDFSDDGALSQQTKEVLAEDIMAIMRPISSNFDYVFYISIPSEKFVWIFFKATDTGTGDVTYYFCGETFPQADPPDFSDYAALKEELTKLIVGVGETSAASSRLKLSKVESDGTIQSGSNAQVDLVIWNATSLEKKLAGRAVKSFDEYAVGQEPWRCEPYSPRS